MASYMSPGAGGSATKNAGQSSVYQIDFTAVASGKRIASTKRRVRWRFGFTNQDALAAGETGTACRGEEHDITLIWSLTSGKRLVLADGQEVHFSNSRGNVFDFSWTMRGNHVLKVIAHASPPMTAAPGYRQYDFFVDGQSFFTMPKVYRLGLSAAAAAAVSEPGVVSMADSTRVRGSVASSRRGPPPAGSVEDLEAPTNPVEEEAFLAEAIRNSLQQEAEKAPVETPREPTPPPKQDENLLIDFFNDPSPTPSAPPTQPAPGHDVFAVAPQPTLTDIGTEFGSVAPSTVSAYTQPPPTPANQVQALPFSPNAYAAPPPQTVPVPAPAAVSISVPAPVPQEDPFTQSTQTTETAQTPAPTAPAPAPTLTMSNTSTGLGSDANTAYAKIANMDNFLVSNNSTSKANNPFDDVVSKTPAPTLAGIKAMGGPSAEKKEVMKSTGVDALVVSSGPQQGNYGGYNNYALGSQAGIPGQPMMGQGYGQAGVMNQQMTPQYGAYNGSAAHSGFAQQQYQQQPQYGQYQPQTSQQGQYYGQQQQQPTQQGYGNGTAQYHQQY